MRIYEDTGTDKTNATEPVN